MVFVFTRTYDVQGHTSHTHFNYNLLWIIKFGELGIMLGNIFKY